MNANSTQVVIAIATISGVVVTLLVGILTLIVRLTIKWARLESTVEQMKVMIHDVDTDSQNGIRSVHDVIRDDRRATNERLQWLERRASPA